MKQIECQECGRIFEVEEGRQGRIIYCSNECRRSVEKRRDAERYMYEKEQNKPPVKKKPAKKKTHLSIGEISVLARQERLTYGQWVARHEYGGR